MTRLYVGPTLDFDIQPVLKPEEVPTCQLTSDPADGPYLGWNTWMPAPMTPARQPADDALFQIPTI